MRASIGAATLALLLAAAACGGCSGDEGGAPAAGGAPAGGGTANPATPPAELKHVDAATAGGVAGVVSFQGTVPEPSPITPSGDTFCIESSHGKIADESLLVRDGKLANAVIWISAGLEGYAFETPAKSVDITQKACTYVPHVVGLMIGQTLRVSNEDPILHNVDAKAKINKPGNLAQPAGSEPREFTFKKAEVALPLVCDVHPWMRASVAVVPHPYFAITGPDGAFHLAGLPPGRYTLEAWHEVLGRQQVEVTVETGKETRAPDLVFHQ